MTPFTQTQIKTSLHSWNFFTTSSELCRVLSLKILPISFISHILPLCNRLILCILSFTLIRARNLSEPFKAPTSVCYTKVICLTLCNTYYQERILFLLLMRIKCLLLSLFIWVYFRLEGEKGIIQLQKSNRLALWTSKHLIVHSYDNWNITWYENTS